MAITIVLTNQKGGVGKTTTSGALATGIAKKGHKVLAIDMDPQGNLGFSLGLDAEISNSSGKTIYELLTGESTTKEVIHHIHNIDIIPSNILLSEAELSLNVENREMVLKEAISQVEDEYDFIIIDTPPSLNILTLNGYVIADYLIIPMSSEILSLVGLAQLKETVYAIKKSVNPRLDVLGILLTRYDKRTKLARDILDMAEIVAEDTESIVFDTKIRTGVAAAEAPAHGLCVVDYAPKSNPGKDYKAFVDEVYKLILHRLLKTGKV